MINNQHALRVGICLLEVVRGQHNGGLLPLPQSVDVVPEVGSVVRIHPSRRLIEKDQPRAVHQTKGDVESAALPAGQRADLSPLERGEIEGLGQLLGPSKGI